MEPEVEAALRELARRLSELGGVTALWVGGSLATGDYVPGVSDLDLVAVTAKQVDTSALVALHRDLDAGLPRGMDLGCQYVDAARLGEAAVEHPTWTHGELVHRTVSLVARAELVLHGFAVFGPTPQDLLPPVGPDDVRAAARAELAGYWAWAARHPLLFARLPVMVDLGLTAMARARHTIRTGELRTKSAAVEDVRAPAWLRDQVRARRHGELVTSPRWRAAYLAWRDVRRTTSSIGSGAHA